MRWTVNIILSLWEAQPVLIYHYETKNKQTDETESWSYIGVALGIQRNPRKQTSKILK